MSTNQYTERNAAFAIDGYYTRSPSQNVSMAFERSKQEAITELQKRIEAIERIEFGKWTELTEVPEAKKVIN